MCRGGRSGRVSARREALGHNSASGRTKLESPDRATRSRSPPHPPRSKLRREIDVPRPRRRRARRSRPWLDVEPAPPGVVEQLRDRVDAPGRRRRRRRRTLRLCARRRARAERPPRSGRTRRCQARSIGRGTRPLERRSAWRPLTRLRLARLRSCTASGRLTAGRGHSTAPSIGRRASEGPAVASCPSVLRAERSPHASPRRFAAIAALAPACALVVQASGPNQAAHFALVRALAYETAEIDPRETIDAAYVDGRFYAAKAPGLAMFTLPWYGVLRAVGLQDAPLATEAGYTPRLWELNLFGAVLPALALLAADRPGGRAASRRASGCRPPSCSARERLLLPFATLFFDHALSAALGFAAFVVLLARERDGRRGRSRRGCRAARGPRDRGRVPACARGARARGLRGRRAHAPAATARRVRVGLARRRRAAPRLQHVGLRLADDAQLHERARGARRRRRARRRRERRGLLRRRAARPRRGALAPLLGEGAARRDAARVVPRSQACRCSGGRAGEPRRSSAAASRSRSSPTTPRTTCPGAGRGRARASSCRRCRSSRCRWRSCCAPGRSPSARRARLGRCHGPRDAHRSADRRRARARDLVGRAPAGRARRHGRRPARRRDRLAGGRAGLLLLAARLRARARVAAANGLARRAAVRRCAARGLGRRRGRRPRTSAGRRAGTLAGTVAVALLARAVAVALLARGAVRLARRSWHVLPLLVLAAPTFDDRPRVALLWMLGSCAVVAAVWAWQAPATRAGGDTRTG